MYSLGTCFLVLCHANVHLIRIARSFLGFMGVVHNNSKVDIVLEGGLPVLADMMHSADVETSHQATGVVANLAEVVENQGKMVEFGEEKPRGGNTTITPVIHRKRVISVDIRRGSGKNVPPKGKTLGRQ